MDSKYTSADTLRKRYESIIQICDSAYLTAKQKKVITTAFLYTAGNYAIAAAEADAWRERFKRLEDAIGIEEVVLTQDEIHDRAMKYWPKGW